MMKNRLPASVVLAIALSVAIVGACKQGPGDTAIREAVTAALERQMPQTWAGSLMGGKATRVKLIEVLKCGDYNAEARSTLIRVRVKGAGEKDLMFSKAPVLFDRKGDFRLTQNELGEWRAEYEADGP